MISIKDNIALLEQQIQQACNAANRNRNEITLIAVSKTKPINLIEQAYQIGQRHFGENYVQEAIDKIHHLQALSDICWHFIGPLQSNKTRLIAENCDWMHTLDREKIALRLNEQRPSDLPPLNVCIQINIDNEPQKSGIKLSELPDFAAFVAKQPQLKLRGIMAVPKKSASESSYQALQQAFQALQQQYPDIDTLSVGMSNDLAIAIKYGATMIRIGTAIFGARDYSGQ